VPTPHSSGGHARLGTISCRGDAYLRTLLIQGARSSLQRAKAVSVEKSTPEQIWIRQLAARMSFGKVLVAIANKHARQLWAMLAHDEAYDADAWLKHPMVQRPAGKHTITHNAMA
jgi:transposase